MLRTFKTMILLLILAVAGYLVYVNFIRTDACNPPDGAPEQWEPPVACIPNGAR